ATTARTDSGTPPSRCGLATRMVEHHTATMLEARCSGLRNPSTWYLGLGLGLLVLSLWVPYLTASRTTRHEARAHSIAQALLEAIPNHGDRLEPVDFEIVLARFFALASRDDVFVNDLEIVTPPLPNTVMTLRNKHYLFHLAESPPDPRESPSRDALPAYEVMAWPRRTIGPAHSVFFVPENAMPSYTRNLAQGYAGAGDDRPAPGCAQRRQALYEWTTSYYGVDDERWIALPLHAGV
ncbi:MAG: hypothetical protein KDC98_14520, partial [Planctomycetes bacterium]|nr:hypothetical protein [Planctomycetota bacterium]